jgi:hypothetical protein
VLLLFGGAASESGAEDVEGHGAEGLGFELRLPRSSELRVSSPFGVMGPRFGRAGNSGPGVGPDGSSGLLVSRILRDSRCRASW